MNIYSKTITSIILIFYTQLANAQFSPSDLSNLSLWLKADSGVVITSGAVSQWSDISGNNFHAVQTAANQRPTLVSVNCLNSRPAIRFDGTNDRLNGTIIPGFDTSSLTIFVVLNGNSQTGTLRGIFGAGTTTSGGLLLRNMTNGAFTVYNNGQTINTPNGSLPSSGFNYTLLEYTKIAGSSAQLYVNGQATGNAGGVGFSVPFTNATYVIGPSGVSTPINGDIADIILYTRELTATERDSVETYIYKRYTKPVSIGPDIDQLNSVCAVTLSALGCYSSYLWSTGSTTPSISVNRPGKYWVSAIDFFGRVSTDTVLVNLPNVSLNAQDTTICTGTSLIINPQLQNLNSFTYFWNDSTITPTRVVAQSGNYYALIRDSFNCIVSSDTLTVIEDTFSISLGADATMCMGDIIGLVSTENSFYSYDFIWSNGSSDSVITAVHPGSYSVTVTNDNSCNSVDTIVVLLSGSTPTVLFLADSICLGNSFTPTNYSYSNDTSNIASYLWQFDNGDSSVAFQPNYNFLSDGTYNVSLKATTSTGCFAVTVQQLVVKQSPFSTFVVDQACVSNSVQFTDLTISSINNPVHSWNWDFGDTSLSNLQHPQHIYINPGIYQTTQIVTSQNGCKDTAVINVLVVSNAPLPSIPNLLTPTNSSQQAANTVEFKWNTLLNSSNYSLVLADDSLFSNVTVYSGVSDTLISITLPGSKTYYWKIHSYNFCNDLVSSSIRNFTLFSPIDISGLSLWLSADTGVLLTSGAVSQWSDISGNNLHAIQSVSTQRPTLVNVQNLNNKPAIRFDGSNDRLNGPIIPGLDTSSLSIFIVVNGYVQTGTLRGIFGVGTTTNGSLLLRNITNNSFSAYNNNLTISTSNGTAASNGFDYTLLEYIKSAGSSTQLNVNGQTSGTIGNASFATPITNAPYVVGPAGVSTTINGDIADIILYNRVLSLSEKLSVEKYIYNKYTHSVDLGLDVVQLNSVCPITLDAGAYFKDYLWSTGDTTKVISVIKRGNYWVRAKDVFDRYSYDTVFLDLPYSGMNFYDTTICVGNYSVISPNISNSVSFNFLWNDIAVSTTPSISTVESGSYYCTITDLFGCSFTTDTSLVKVDSFSLTPLLPTDTSVCAGNQLAINLGIYIPQSIQWSTGSTTSAISIATAANYSVDVTDVYGCNVKDTTTVTLKGIAPITDFIFGASCTGKSVQFTDQSTTSMPDVVSSWLWNFGDGHTATGGAATNTFNSSGDFTVSLQVSTDSGCTGATSKILHVNPKPIADYIYPNSSPICAGTSTTLYDSSAVIITDTITQWQWLINGNQIFSTKNVTYTFGSQGTTPISLAVTTNKGCSDTLSNVIEVFAPLVPDFSFENVCQGDSVAFTDITPSYSVVSWQWNFGDGSFYSTLQNPKHKYLSSGLKNVKLIIQNAIGCINEITKPVSIVQKPIAAFVSPNTCEDILFSPQDSSISIDEPISIWIWEIGNSAYTGQIPQHLFSDTGTYSIQLIVATTSGCSDTTQKSTIIHVNPVSDFTFSPLYGEAPININFNNLSSYADSYLWNFGDGGSSTDFEPSYTYNLNDTFDISLTAVSGYGCVDSVSKKFIAIKTDLDISVDEVSTNQTIQPDGSVLITITARASNVGTRIITDATFRATLGSGGVIEENWNGVLQSGQIMDYTFSAKFVVAATNAQTYVCVEAESVNIDQTEIRTDNNRECASLTGSIQLVGPSPNPAFKQATLGIILPKTGSVGIAITDMLGHYIINPTSIQLSEGRNDYVIPINQLKAAEYLILVKYLDDRLVRKFVVR